MISPVRNIKLLTDTEMPNKIPGSYNVDPSTNIYKLLKMFQEEINEFREAGYGVEDVHDLDKVFGYSLDLLASDYGIIRDGQSDTELLNKIKAFIYSRGSYGDSNTIIKTLNSYFGLGENAFSVTRVDTRKIEVAVPDGTSLKDAGDIAGRVKAAGIRLETVPDRYWSDLNYESGTGPLISDYTYKELEKYKYERRVIK